MVVGLLILLSYHLSSLFSFLFCYLCIISQQNEKLYVQVTQELRSPKTEKREYERLLEIHDNYPKYVLTTDEFSGGNYEGIKTMHIADFLLSSEY